MPMEVIFTLSWRFPIILPHPSLRFAFVFTFTLFAFIPSIFAQNETEFGNTLLVTKADDTKDGVCDSDCSLREAIAVANGSAEITHITFDPSLDGATITLIIGELLISADMVIEGLGIDNLTVSGNNLHRVFVIRDSSTVTISDMTVQDSTHFDDKTGIIDALDSDLLVERVRAQNSTIIGIQAHGGTTRIVDSFSHDNEHRGLRQREGTIHVINTMVTNSGGTSIGLNRSVATIENSHLADGQRRGISTFGSDVTVINTTIVDHINDGDGDGCAGIQVQSITGSPARLAVVNSVIARNQNDFGNGGGICVDDSESIASYIEIRESTIAENHAALNGGGIYLQSLASDTALSIFRSTIAHNTAEMQGGGIYLQDGQALITNSTISGNHSLTNGGGIGIVNHSDDLPELILKHVTIFDNEALVAGGGIFGQSEVEVAVGNTIVGNNTGSDCGALLVLDVAGMNLHTDGSCVGFQLLADPLLDSLADNGGATQTHALHFDSPAIGVGSNSVCSDLDIMREDQRSFERDDFCDLGAYEYDAQPVAVTVSQFAISPNRLTGSLLSIMLLTALISFVIYRASSEPGDR